MRYLGSKESINGEIKSLLKNFRTQRIVALPKPSQTIRHRLSFSYDGHVLIKKGLMPSDTQFIAETTKQKYLSPSVFSNELKWYLTQRNKRIDINKYDIIGL